MVAGSETRPQRAAGAATRSAARNSALGGAGAVASSAAGFGFALVAGRSLGVGGSGVLFTSIALATVLTALATLGADTALLWAVSRDRALDGGRDSRRLLALGTAPVLAASCVAAIGLWLAAPLVARAVAGPDVRRVVEVAAVAVLLGPALVCLLQVTRGLGNLLPFTLLNQVAVPVARLAGLALLVTLLPSVSRAAAMAAWALPLLAATPLAWVVARRRSRVPVGPPVVDPLPAGAFWRYALLRGLGTSASMALTWADVVIVAAFAGPVVAGGYAAASRFATSGLLGLQALRLGISPGVAAAHARGDRRTVADLYHLGARCAVLLSWPAYCVLIVFAGTALGWFGQGFDRAVPALVVLAVAMMVNVAAGNVATLLLMSGHSGVASRNTAVALGLTLALDLALVPGLGATGAAIGWLAGVLAENGLGVLQVSRRLGVSPDLSTLALTGGGVVVLSLGASLALRTALGPSTAALLASAAASTVATLGLAWVLRGRLQLALLRTARPAAVR